MSKRSDGLHPRAGGTGRSWPWILTVGALAGAIGVGGLAVLRSLGSGFPVFLLVAILGGLAAVLIVASSFYVVRKRHRPLSDLPFRVWLRSVLTRRGRWPPPEARGRTTAEPGRLSAQELMEQTKLRRPWSMITWLKSHVYLGLLALFAALIHSLIPPFRADLSTGNLALLVLTVLVVSGVAWRFVYVTVPPRVGGDPTLRSLATSNTERKLEATDVEIAKVGAGRSEAFGDLKRRLLAGEPPERLDAEAGSLDEVEHGAWEELKRLAHDRRRYGVRLGRQERYQRVLQGWKLLHLPLAAILGGVIVVHVLDVFGAGRAVFGDAASEFASSADCGDCHTDITDEWFLSQHADAQLSPITVAQTALAVEKDPSIGAFCVNCHAPVGAQLTGAQVFPLDEEGHLGNILSEGVTCTACHTLRNPPGLRRGGEPGFPVQRRGSTTLGTVYGPPLRDPPPLPVPAHGSEVGFMSDPTSSSRLCGACHIVQVDLNGDGDFVNNEGEDLVLQETFLEWKDYIAERGEAESCIGCHMPERSSPLVDSAPLSLSLPERLRHVHTFVGVDYDLTPGHYAALGVGADALQRVLAEREALLRQAAGLRVVADAAQGGRLNASVRIDAIGVGHKLPTGFAFVRQMWLEVSAETTSGEPVCLVPDEAGIESPCVSGLLDSPRTDLATCDPLAVRRRRIGRGLEAVGDKILLTAPAPLESCDPWLANFQTVLTDGDPDSDGVFEEVAYQSLQPDIVRVQVRAADQEEMKAIEPDASATFDYEFDVSGLSDDQVVVRAVLHFRHLPPYFLRALDGFYPPGVSSDRLLDGMTIVDMAEARSRPTAVG